MHPFSSLPVQTCGLDLLGYITRDAPILSKETAEKPEAPLRRHLNPLGNLMHIFALTAPAAMLRLSFRSVHCSDETE